jgi:glucose/arabinose dehydrogenase
MRFRPALPLLLAATALAACSQAEDEAAAPTPTPTLTTQALPTEAPDGTPLAIGEWLVEETAGGASATFREQSGANALVLVCDRAGRALSLSRAGTAAAPQRLRLTVGAQKADVMMAPGGALGLTATVDRAQPIFAAFADPAAVIEVSGSGAEALRVPGHPGISRVLAACG